MKVQRSNPPLAPRRAPTPTPTRTGNASAAGSRVRDTGEWVLRKIIGRDWMDFLTRRPLAGNRQDQGPEWLTRISRRLDGSKNEGVGVLMRLGAQLPTPVVGLTITANSSTEAMLRRTPAGKLELLYTMELSAGLAAQLRAGLSTGITFGQAELKAEAMAQAGAQGQGTERMILVYEVDPRSRQEMDALATQLKGQLLEDGYRVRDSLRPANFYLSMRDRFRGKSSLGASPQSRNPATQFGQRHLSQASFYHGVRLSANAQVLGGVSYNQDGITGSGGFVLGPGMDRSWQASQRDAQALAGWKKQIDDGADFLIHNLPPNITASGALDLGMERTLDFDRGRYLTSTVALTSDRALYGGLGAFRLRLGREIGTGHRYALTYDAKGLVGVDYSVRMLIRDGLKRQAEIQREMKQKVELEADRPWDPLILTYSLDPAEVERLGKLSPEARGRQLGKVFSDGDFRLSRLLCSHGKRIQVGGWFEVGMGPFIGGRAYVGVDYGRTDVQLSGKAPADPLPADRPWTLRLR